MLCNAFSFGYLPGVWVLKADVSEHFIGSIFIGRSMKYDRGWSVWDKSRNTIPIFFRSVKKTNSAFAIQYLLMEQTGLWVLIFFNDLPN